MVRRKKGYQSVHVGAEFDDEEVEFLRAIDRYKRKNRNPFPTWKEVLDVLRSLGWRKVIDADSKPAGGVES